MTTPRWTAGPVAGLMIISFVLLGSDRAPSIETAALAAPAAPAQPTWRSCVADQATVDTTGLERAPLSDTSAPIAAVICSQPVRQFPDGRQETSRVEARADDITALITALRLPDEPYDGQVCVLMGQSEPWLVLLDAHGHWISPRFPENACGFTRLEAQRAYDALKLTVVSSEIIDFRAAPRWFNTGCWETSNNPVSTVTTEQPRRPRSGRVTNPFPAGVRVRMCAYQVPPDQRYGDYGAFDYAADLDARQRARLDRALRKVRPAAACDRPATRFGTLFRGDHRLGAVSVELDGCRRMVVITVDGRSTLAAADPAIVAMIVQIGQRRPGR